MKVLLPTVFIVLVLFLTYNSESVFCFDAEPDDDNTYEENPLVLNYCDSEEFSTLENGETQTHDIFVPSVAITDYIPRTFRLKKIESLSCSELSNETFYISFKANQLVQGAEFYSLNGTLYSTEPSDHVIYDYDQPEINNVTILKRTSRLDNLLTPKGMLKAGYDYFYTDEFCIERVNKSGLFMKTCEIDCDNGKTPCVKMCCPLGEVFDFGEQNCYYSGDIEWRPTFYSDIHTKLENATNHRVHYRRVLLKCTTSDQLGFWTFRELPGRSPHVSIKVLRDGSITYIGPTRTWVKLEYDNCISGMQNFTTGYYPSYFTGAEEDQAIFLCNPGSQENRELSYYYVGAMLISSVFLVMTAAVYILLWEKQNIHGWTILSFVISMFLMFVFLTIARLLGELGEKHGGTFYCIANGALAHFFFLSTFCWLSIINFDVWWTLRCNTPLSERSKGVKRFCLYIIFSWGGPILVVSIGFILQYTFPDPESLVMIPSYGVYTCFVSVYAQGVYVYYIMSVLMVWNFIFMFLTFYTLYRFRQGTSTVRLTSTHQQNLFCTLVKLFVVMGPTWCLEVISWHHGGSSQPWWFSTDMINVFQAIGIFIIFVCKRQIISQLQAKFRMCKTGLRPSGSQTTSTTLSARNMSLRTDVDRNTSIIKKNLPKQFSHNNVLVGTKL